jgi:hypothetical protein
MEIPTLRIKLNGALETTDEVATLWQADPLAVEIGLFASADTPVIDFANVASFAFLLSRDRREETLVASKSIAKAAMDAESFTLAQWDAGTHQHVTFPFSSAEMNIDLLDADERLWWSVVLTLTSGDLMTAGGGYIILAESGSLGAPSSAAGSIYSVVPDSGGVEWLQISRPGLPDKFGQLFDSIP